MSFIRALLPVAALAVGAQAASASCAAPSGGTLTVTNAGDAAGYSGCSTFTGSIAIATGAVTFSFDGPKRITGDLIALEGGNLQTLEAADLQTIDGTFNVTAQSSLVAINMPSLTQVTTFYISHAGQSFNNLNFGSPGLTTVTDLTVDDTYLGSLTGINVTSADNIAVTNNQLLTNLTMSVKSASGGITIRGNANGLNVNFNNLETCGDVNINQCSTVQLNSLKNASGDVNFGANLFTTLSLPNLTTAGQGFTVSDNPMLTNLSVPLLQSTSGALDVQDNADLNGNITFPALQQVGGAVNITGNFSGFFLPAIQRVRGVFNVSSQQNIASSCSIFTGESSRFAIAPKCGPTSSSTSGGSGGSGTGSGSSSSSGAASHYSTPEIGYSLFGALAALIGLLL